MSNIYNLDSFTRNIHGGYDTNNNPKAGTTLAMAGFIERKNHLVLNPLGEEVTSSSNILIDYNTAITLEDTITFDGRTWQIIAIQHEKDFTNKITRLYLR